MEGGALKRPCGSAGMTMRVFFALELPPSMREALAAFQAECRTLPLRAAWTDPWKLHLTLAFLAEQPEERLPALLV